MKMLLLPTYDRRTGYLQCHPSLRSLTPICLKENPLVVQSQPFPPSQSELNANSLLQNFRSKNFSQTSVEWVLMRVPWRSDLRLCGRNFSAEQLLGTLLDEMSKPEGIKKVHFHIGNITGFLLKTFSTTSCPHCNSPVFSNELLTSVKDIRHTPRRSPAYYKKNQSQQKIAIFPLTCPKYEI